VQFHKGVASSLFGRLIRVAFFVLVVAACSLAGAQSWQRFNVFLNVGGTSDETGRQMLQDASGSIFTLSTSGSGLVVAKRDASGAAIWKSYFAAEPSGLALTPDGGAAVVCRIDRGNSPTVREIITLKYDANGSLIWSRTLTGVTTLADSALRAVATSDGSIYVGATVNQDLFSDVSLIKYSPAGDLLWQKTQGPNPDQETCLTLKPDPAGNILLYANRNPFGSGQGIIYKYSPAGNLIWSYVAPQSGTMAAVAMDSTGASYLPINGGNPAVIKVGANGVQAFKTSLGLTNAPLSIALLGTNAFVAGVQTGTAKCFVQKINGIGSVAWTATHTGPSGEAEALNAVGVAPDGTVYASGNRTFTGSAGIFTLKVGATGTVAWAADHGTYTYTPPIIPPLPPVPPPPLIPTNLAINGASQPVMFSTINGPGSQTGYDSEVCVDSSVGAAVASNHDDLNGTHDIVDSSTTTADGTTYILADSQQNGGTDVVLEQVHSDGSTGWLRGFGGPGPDLGYAVALEPDGGAVVSYGLFNSGTNLWDTRVRRLDPSGATLWTTALDGSDHIASMTCAPDGSIYMVGQDQRVLPFRFHAAKVGPTGTVIWSTLYSGVGPSDDYPFKIALDALGNLFVCGNLWDGNRYLATVQRYDATTGAVDWTSPYASSGAGASAFTLIPDNLGNAYALGTDWATGGRGLIRKFDVNGNLIFSRISTELDTISERFVSGALDTSGNLVIGGSAVRPDKNVDLMASKYSSNGILIWKQLYDGPAGLNDIGRFLSIDSLGSIYLGGSGSGGTTGRDYVLWKLNTDGSPAWPDSGDNFTHSAVLYDSGLHLADTVAGLSTDTNGNVYVSGAAIGTNNTYDINSMKFGPTYNAAFVSQTVPATMTAGQTYFINMSYTNTSNFTWTPGAGIELGSMNPIDNVTWGLNRVPMTPGESIAPGATKKFASFRVFAPTIGGTYNFQCSMRQSSFGPFGDLSPNVPVVVAVAPDAARYVGQTSPTTVKVGAAFNVSIRMRNVGSNTWTQGAGYALAPSGSPTTWGITQVLVSSNIGPGVEKQFVFTCHAPTTAGTYVFRFQMRKTSGFFGDVTASKTITVTP
jgi:hypothetical protein